MESAAPKDLVWQVRQWKTVPPLRLDLRFVRFKETGTYRLCDPKTQKFVELFELECLIAQAIDGERTIADLTDMARGFNPTIEPQQIEQLLVQLLEFRLLDIPRDPSPDAKQGMGKVIALPVHNPPSGDEFAAFRNEVVLDLQRDEAALWKDAPGASRRTPFFDAVQAAPATHADHVDDDDLGGNTNLVLGSGRPFEALERRTAQHLEEDDTVLSSSLPPQIYIPPGPTPPPPAPRPAPVVPTRPQSSPPAGEDEAPATPEANPAKVSSDVEEVWSQSQDKRARWYRNRWLHVLVVLAGVITAAAYIHHPLYITSECSIVPSDRVYVRAPMAGMIAQIQVDEGATVHKGDELVRLDDRDLAADRLKALAEVERIQAELQRLHHGARPEEIAQQRAVLSARVTAASFAQKEAERRRNMWQEGVGSKQAVDEADLDLHVKQNAAAEASAALRLLVAGTRPEDIDAQEAALRRAQAELAFIEKKLAEMIVIRAPIDGVVLTPKFHERLRERVDAGGLICEIAQLSTMHAEIFVAEREADTVTLGMPIVVKVESYPLHAFKGVVDFIAPAVEVRDKSNVVRVVAKLDNADGLLRQDMTGYGEIEAGDRSLLQLATRRFLRWIRVRFLL